MINKKLITGITAAGSVGLIGGQLKYFKSLGYDTYLMAPKDERSIKYCENEECILLDVEIERDINIKKDIKSLLKIISIIKKVKPDIVNFGTPKMGLLGMIASKILGVKRRIYTCRGFRYEHEQGRKRIILRFMEKLAGFCAQEIICISPSVKEFAITDKVFPANKCIVINKGSSNGIDLEKFNSSKIEPELKEDLLHKYALQDKFVFGYVGRLIDRKGISEMYYSFSELFEKNNDLRLLVVGPIEKEQISDLTILDKMENHPGIILTGRTDNVPLYLSLMDVFLLPAWWEGFGNVLVQAAAMGIPVVSTFGTGSRDAVSDGYNGILVKPKSVEELTDAMERMYRDSDLRNKMGKNGIEWSKNFDSKIIWNGMNQLYLKNNI